MKFYVGDEDLGLVVETYKRYGSHLFIKYLDGSALDVIDSSGNYERVLQDKMLKQLQERNEVVDFEFLARKCYFDCVSFVSLYGLYMACLVKHDGNVPFYITIPSVIMGTWGMMRAKESIKIMEDIKKSNLFLAMNDSLGDDSELNVNTLDDYSYKNVRKIYKKVLKK